MVNFRGQRLAGVDVSARAARSGACLCGRRAPAAAKERRAISFDRLTTGRQAPFGELRAGMAGGPAPKTVLLGIASGRRAARPSIAPGRRAAWGAARRCAWRTLAAKTPTPSQSGVGVPFRSRPVGGSGTGLCPRSPNSPKQ